VQAAVNAGFPLLDEGFINLTVEYRDRENTNHSGRDPRQIFNFTEQVNGSPQLSTGTLPPEEATFDRRNHRYGDPDSENWYFSWNSAIPVGDLELYSFGGIARREGESGGFYRREYDGRTIPSIHPGGFLPLINTDVDDDSIGVGIEGEMGSFDFDASVVYGENEFDFFISNSNNVTLGPTSPTSADAGGLVFDQLTFNLDFVTTIDLLGLEDVSTAFGVEYRQDGYEIRAGEFASWANGPLDDDDPTTTADAAAAFPNQYGGTGAPGIQVFPGFRPSNSLDEDRDSWALYTDFEADISDDWLVGFALRFEDYDDFGSTLNGKLASRYNISDSLALRGAVSTGFRAPSLHQQFFNNTSTQFVTVGGVPNVPTEVGTLRNDDPVVRNGFGIPELDEETSVNLSAGFAWTPADGLTITTDFYWIQVDDRVVLSGRFSKESVGNDGMPCAMDNSNCPIAAILPDTVNSAQFFSNAIDTETAGIDIIIEYGVDLANGGQLSLDAAANFTTTSLDGEVRIPSGLIDSPNAAQTLYSRQEILWLEDGQPRDHYILGIDYEKDALGLGVRANWFGEVKSTESPDIACEASDSCLDQTFAGKWLVDVEGRWGFTDNLDLAVGVDNVFDTQPDRQETDFNGIFPFSRRTTPFGFNGAYYYAQLSYSFGHGLN